MEEKESKLKTMKEILKNKKTRQIVFFGFYAVFFIVLIMMIKESPKESIHPPKPSGNSSYSLDAIQNDNYHFEYVIKKEKDIYKYTGLKNKNTSSFIKEINNIKTTYLVMDNKYYELKENAYQPSNNPYILSSFLNIKTIKDLLSQSKFISKTEFANKDIMLTYFISNELIKDNIPGSYQEVLKENSVISLTTKNKQVNKIELNLSSFQKEIGKDEVLQITLTYDQFDEITSVTLN